MQLLERPRATASKLISVDFDVFGFYEIVNF